MVKKGRVKSINSVLREQISLIKLDKETMRYLKSITKEFTETLKKEIKKKQNLLQMFSWEVVLLRIL